MNQNKNIAIVTYTNSSCKDVWPVYFGQLNNHIKDIKSYVISDIDGSADYENHSWLRYKNEDPYFKQWEDCIGSVEEEYIIYSQEDFFMYGDVSSSSLARYVDFLESSDYSYVRLIRCGYSTPLVSKPAEGIYDVDMNSSDAFSMQATLWKKKNFMKLYSHVKSEKWLEAEHWNKGCRDLSIKGSFVYNNEPPRGKFHYDSLVFPYVCTGIVKGLWNTNEYPRIMRNILEKYNIDTSIRGERGFYGQRGEKSTVWSVS